MTLPESRRVLTRTCRETKKTWLMSLTKKHELRRLEFWCLWKIVLSLSLFALYIYLFYSDSKKTNFMAPVRKPCAQLGQRFLFRFALSFRLISCSFFSCSLLTHFPSTSHKFFYPSIGFTFFIFICIYPSAFFKDGWLSSTNTSLRSIPLPLLS